MNYRKSIVLLVAWAFLAGCKRSSPSVATDEASSRSECAQAGKKIMEVNKIGSGLMQNYLFHYDQKSGQCYVELDVEMQDASKFDEYNSRSVYDARSHEILAYVEHKNGIRTGFLRDSPQNHDFEAATAKIDALMANN